MNASLSAPVWARKVVVIPSLLLAATAVTAVVVGSESASGTDDGTSSEFTTVGDGALPTAKPKLGALRDPLSALETGYAIHLASTHGSIPDDSTTVKGGPGPEFLYADIPDQLGHTTRQAVVMLYDYTSDTAYQQTVDLAAGKVIDSLASRKLQPATSTDEADVAVQVAIESGKKLAFKREFEAAQGVPLVSAEQVHYVAGAFTFDGSTATGQECGVDRCAQLMVQTAAGSFLGTSDFVVNLSTQSVIEIK